MTNGDAHAQPDFDSIGRALVALCGTFQSLGHGSPVGSVTDYITRPGDEPGGFVWDMFAICDPAGDPDAAARLAAFADRHDVADVIAEAVAR